MNTEVLYKNPKKTFLVYLLITAGVILLDQGTKLLVFKYMDIGFPGEIKLLGNWLKLHYTLNPGMAFGVEVGLTYGKLVLSIFRLFAVTGIAWYLFYLIKKQSPKGLLICMALILGGAIGNVIDSTFYGVVLHNAPFDAPMPWFHGQVIDMVYVDIWEGYLPNWLPVIGGQYYAFWPIFNVADSSIFIGVSIILLFQGRFIKPLSPEKETIIPPHTDQAAPGKV